jgi:hypothetical protein
LLLLSWGGAPRESTGPQRGVAWEPQSWRSLTPSPIRRGYSCCLRIVSSFAQVLSLEHTRFIGRMQGRLDLPGTDAWSNLAGPGEDGERGGLRHLCKVSPDDSRTLLSSGALLRGWSHIFRAASPGVDRPPVVMISMASRAGFRGSAIPTACLYSMAFLPVDLGDGSTLGSEASWCAKDCFLAGSVPCV